MKFFCIKKIYNFIKYFTLVLKIPEDVKSVPTLCIACKKALLLNSSVKDVYVAYLVEIYKKTKT